MGAAEQVRPVTVAGRPPGVRVALFAVASRHPPRCSPAAWSRSARRAPAPTSLAGVFRGTVRRDRGLRRAAPAAPGGVSRSPCGRRRSSSGFSSRPRARCWAVSWAAPWSSSSCTAAECAQGRVRHRARRGSGGGRVHLRCAAAVRRAGRPGGGGGAGRDHHGRPRRLGRAAARGGLVRVAGVAARRTRRDRVVGGVSAVLGLAGLVAVAALGSGEAGWRARDREHPGVRGLAGLRRARGPARQPGAAVPALRRPGGGTAWQDVVSVGAGAASDLLRAGYSGAPPDRPRRGAARAAALVAAGGEVEGPVDASIWPA